MLLDTPAVQLNLHAASYSNGLGGVCEALTIIIIIIIISEPDRF